MVKGNRLNSLANFVFLALGITVSTIIPLLIVDIYYPVIKDWWEHDIINGLWLLLPSSIILVRWLYKIIKHQTKAKK